MTPLGALFFGLCSSLLAFASTMILTPYIIRILQRLKAGQVIQQDGPQSHQAKAGTPSMGGIAILVGLFFPGLIAYRVAVDTSLNTWTQGEGTAIICVILVTIAYGLIGFLDDWLTMRPKNGKRGLSSKVKFVLQFIVAIGFIFALDLTGNLDPMVSIGPEVQLNLGWAYAPLAVLVITGMANFINITDGLDGLAAGLTVIVALAIAAVPAVIAVGPAGTGYVSNTASCVLLAGLAGACAAFLWFNCNPAKVFMGDTGSLAIGVLIPAVAIVGKMEIPMIIAGMVFILDGLSSALQWAVFKYTRIRTGTGRRIFKMSPIHHHFELSGWPEQLVVVRFWIVGGLFALVAVWLAIGT